MSIDRAERIAGRARALAARGLDRRAAALRAPLLLCVLTHGAFTHKPAGAIAMGPVREGGR